MARKYAIRDQDKFYFVTFTVIHWIDLFIREEYRQIIIDSTRFCQKEKGLLIGAWCIMTGHIHMIIGTNGENNLEHIVRDLKSFTSDNSERKLRRARLKVEGNGLWMQWRKQEPKNQIIRIFSYGCNTITQLKWVRAEWLIPGFIIFIPNPVEAGFVDEPKSWRYSSAMDYCGGAGLVDLVFLD